MSIDNPNLYGAMTDAVAASEDELALYGYTTSVETLSAQGRTAPIIWVEWDNDREHPETFENVPEFEAWASKTIDAHREATA